jgi:hypothetical protein
MRGRHPATVPVAKRGRLAENPRIPTPGSRKGRPGERESSRYPLNADVEVLDPFHAHGVVINHSEGGLRVALDRELPLDVVCVLEIRLDEGKTVEMAKVVWSRGHPDGCLVGFQFVDA